jgi:hypothetical protein
MMFHWVVGGSCIAAALSLVAIVGHLDTIAKALKHIEREMDAIGTWYAGSTVEASLKESERRS